MGFWANLFGKAKSATDATVAPEDGGPKSESDVRATQPQSSSAPAPAQPVAAEVDGPGPDSEAEATPPQGASAPAPSPEPEPEPAPLSNGVEYRLTTYGEYPVDPRFLATKKVYGSQSREAAIAFLKTQVVTQPLFYIEVETPDGPLGIDEGRRVFDESGHFIEAESSGADIP
jgi:hypothetical protein